MSPNRIFVLKYLPRFVAAMEKPIPMIAMQQQLAYLYKQLVNAQRFKGAKAMTLQGQIVFSSGKNADFDIWVLDFSSDELKQLTNGTNRNDQPRWSPEGEQIAFVSDRSGCTELWLMNADGSEQRQLTDSGKFHANPSWSPDGKRILYCANYSDPNNIDLWTLSLEDGSKPEQLASYPGIESGPCFSPDGKRILLAAEIEGNDDIWELDLDSKELKQITEHSAHDRAPAYSPDGSMIAFVSERDPSSDQEKTKDADVWLTTPEANEFWRVTTNKGADRYVSWSPDGKFLIFCSSPAGADSGRLQVVSLEDLESVGLKYQRDQLESEINATPEVAGWKSKFLPEFLKRELYEKNYFGTERHPHWKA